MHYVIARGGRSYKGRYHGVEIPQFQVMCLKLLFKEYKVPKSKSTHYLENHVPERGSLN